MSHELGLAVEEHTNAVVQARLDEAAHDRLVREAIGPRRPVRAVAASALRTVAGWLDVETRVAAERQLAGAR